MTQLDTVQHPATDAIRPFHINIPEAALVDLRRRIMAWEQPELFSEEIRAAFRSLR